MATPYSRRVPDLPPWSFAPKGRYDEHLFESEVLKANPLHDPHRRQRHFALAVFVVDRDAGLQKLSPEHVVGSRS